ncbi:MAG: primosomal protein N' [Flavobacteriales bacterium]|nr:primosomal protein N' [Flavobacteriales bacterium]
MGSQEHGIDTMDRPIEERSTYFAEVVVPLHVPGSYTYRVPRKFEDRIRPGMRALVQFGRKKVYAGLVISTHHKAPTDYQAKYVLDLLDAEAIVTSHQLDLFQWMASYYMCYPGDVINASLPAGFRLSSETMISKYDDPGDLELDTPGHLVMSTLDHRTELSMDDLTEMLGGHTAAYQTISRLIAKKAVSLHEVVKEKYKPKYETYLLLNPAYESESAMQSLFDQLEKRAKAQTAILMRFIELSRYGSGNEIPVLKKELLEKSGVSPGVLKSLTEKEILHEVKEEVGRIKDHRLESPIDLQLNEEQSSALSEIQSGMAKGLPVLLHGVTSSGKTEVYIELIKTHLQRDEQVLYLVPEIALTTQLIQRLQSHFGEKVAVYHSHHSQAERMEIWQNLNSPGIHDHRIILGARSSIFLPFQKLGLIIVDEEHDSSFKQYDPAPRYQARDTALMLGRFTSAQVLLGSATPSVESIHMCNEGRMKKVEMKKRFGGISMPEILVADLGRERRRRTMTSHFSSLLMESLHKALNDGKQVILFQNRRGYNPLWQCEDCAWTPECRRCDVSMTYHKAAHLLKCHYCGSSGEPPLHCPSCGSKELKMLGFGTEKIEAEMATLLPDARIQRMDLDTTRGKHAYTRILSDFDQRKIDVLIGTQMVTKGLDFANVAVVGILNADLLINRSDFRAFERAYQLMTQVAGRAGRDAKGERGKVIIQTAQPEHWVVRNVVDHSYERLIEQELLERRNFKYPPFVRMITLKVSHKKQELVDHGANELARRLRAFLGERVLGPQFPYISRIKDRYRMEMIVKIEREASISQVKLQIQDVVNRFGTEKDFKSLRVTIDVDPQ